MVGDVNSLEPKRAFWGRDLSIALTGVDLERHKDKQNVCVRTSSYSK
ncbi:hypothetical protein NPIL_496111, partial [Nephila pilipes]